MRSFLFLLLTVSPATAFAQGIVQPVPGTTDADRLGATMRRVAANPRDVDALVTAGEQSLKVDDLSGAASLFARAEKIDPRNGRVKAGMASILVRSERPGEALRYFDQAAAFGLDPRRFAADRGLAYDLIGEQERAQRDYKLALQAGGDDETIRRYALSLGISGRGDEALKQLDPLLGKTDRAAWRARAFVLAMGGDQAAAERIASTMMPGGMAQGLLPFFRRLPTLPAADRAFAVHFGEVRAGPERLADARLAPALTPLTPEPRSVALAALTTPATTQTSDRRRDRGSRRERPGRTPIEQVAALPAPALTASRPVQVAGLTSPPVPAQMRPAPTGSNPLPARPETTFTPERTVTQASSALTVAPGFTTLFAPATREIVRATPTPPATVPSGAPTTGPGSATPAIPSALATTGFAVPVGTSTTPPLPTANAGLAASNLSEPSAAVIGVSSATPLPGTSAPSVALAGVAPASSATVSTVTPTVSTATSPVSTVRETATAIAARARATAAPAAVVAGPPPSRVGSDSVLARIIASLSIPAEELGVTGPARPVAAPLNDGAARTAEAVRIKTARDADAEAAAERLATRVRTADRRALAAKTAADKKIAAEKKAAADKLAEERRIARSNPPRIWVQVAGGANERDLARAWSAAKAKAPKALGGRGGYTTPLRATNRVLTGPFKTDADARSFVNQLSKQGVSAFTFTSDQGQSISRLATK